MRTAVVIGSTGLTGQVLVEKLALNNSWSQILAVTRRSVTWTNPKIRNISFDFTAWPNLELQIKSYAGTTGIDFFCALGTTIKAAGSKKAFKKIDLEAVIRFAQIAKSCGAGTLIIMSSVGADEMSKSFYLKTKGEMEKQVGLIGLNSVFILRPSLLLGDRHQFRLGERLAMLFAPVICCLAIGSLKKYRPVSIATVASTMISLALKKELPDKANSGIEIIQK